MNRVVKPPSPTEAETTRVSRRARVATPKAGPIDIRALHDEVAAKFPKTIARLAE